MNFKVLDLNTVTFTEKTENPYGAYLKTMPWQNMFLRRKKQ